MNSLPLHLGISHEQQTADTFSGEQAASDVALPAKVRDYIRAALSENSRKAYRTDLRQFLAWGGSIPASPEMVARYLAAHAEHHVIATLARRLVSIGKAHTTQGFQSPVDSDLVRATLRGIRHTHGSAQRQVAPAEKEDVLSMVAGLTGIKGTRDRALLLIGFAGAFRRSELVSLTVTDIEHAKQGLIVQLSFSKTDQDGRGRNVAIPYARGAVCPVLALQRWLDLSGISGGPIFRPVNRHGVIADTALTPQAVALVVKERAKAVGLDPARYAGHSLRAGLVTSAAKLGVSGWKIRQQTGHASDAMLARYIRDANIFVDNAAGVVL
jgi:site-specific recombinase XerD